MNRKYKGYELYKMIAERKMQAGTEFIDENGQSWEFDGTEFKVNGNVYSDFEFSIMKFEIVEDSIKIQKIEPLTITVTDGNLTKKSIEDIVSIIGSLRVAVRQLDKRISKMED